MIPDFALGLPHFLEEIRTGIYIYIWIHIYIYVYIYICYKQFQMIQRHVQNYGRIIVRVVITQSSRFFRSASLRVFDNPMRFITLHIAAPPLRCFHVKSEVWVL